MASAIDPTKPTTALAYTADVRANFAAAKTEIEALQTTLALGTVIVGATPDATARGRLWWDTVSGQLFVEYDDGTTTQWVMASSAVLA
jgi:hypothetical protein